MTYIELEIMLEVEGSGIHCKTEEEAKEFLDEAKRAGFSVCEADTFQHYKGETVYVYRNGSIKFDKVEYHPIYLPLIEWSEISKKIERV